MTDKTRIRRLPERGVKNREVINAILDEGLVCHVGYVTEDRPVVIPTLYARDGDRLLLHGSPASGLVRAARAGSPLSISVAHVDGVVVARSAFHSSANYRSVVVHGSGQILEGDEHRLALDVIVEKLIPGRLADLRSPSEAELRQTAVIEVPLNEVSAKTRTGDPHDDPDDLGSDVWAGVVPLKLTWGEPISAADLDEDQPVPPYLIHYRS